MAVTSVDEQRLSTSQKEELQRLTDEYDNMVKNNSYDQATMDRLSQRAAEIRANPEGTNPVGDKYFGYTTSADGTYQEDIAGQTLNNNNKKEETKTQTQSQTQTTTTTPTYVSVSTYTPGSFNDFLKSETGQYIDSQIKTASDAEVDAIDAATQQSILQIQNNIANSESEYKNMAAEAYLQSMQNQDNLVLQNYAAGNTGGVAQKEYSDARASYDQQLLAISLQYQQLKTEAENQIAQLQAEGKYQSAQAVANWANQKLDTMLSAYQWTEQMALNASQYNYDIATTERNYLYNRALSMLEQGVLTADAVEALGVSAEDAQSVADYYNSMARLNLESAIASFNSSYNTGSTGSYEDGTPSVVDTSKYVDTGYTVGDKAVYIDSNTKTFVYADGTPVPVGTVFTDGTDSYIVTADGFDAYSGTPTDETTGGEPKATDTGAKQKSDFDSAATWTNFDSVKDFFSKNQSLINYISDGGYKGVDTSNFYNATDGTNHFGSTDRERIYAATKQVSDEDYDLATARLGNLTSSQIYSLGADGLVEYFGLWASNDVQTGADVAKTLADDYRSGLVTYNQAKLIADLMSAGTLFTNYINNR